MQPTIYWVPNHSWGIIVKMEQILRRRINLNLSVLWNKPRSKDLQVKMHRGQIRKCSRRRNLPLCAVNCLKPKFRLDWLWLVGVRRPCSAKSTRASTSIHRAYRPTKPLPDVVATRKSSNANASSTPRLSSLKSPKRRVHQTANRLDKMASSVPRSAQQPTSRWPG